MPILMMINLKGGVAKTTTAVAVAECLAERGQRTLVIDADHQAMAGELLLGETRQIKADQSKRTLHDLLLAVYGSGAGSLNFSSYVTRYGSDIRGGLKHLSVLPCSTRIDNFAGSLRISRAKRASVAEMTRLRELGRRRLRQWLEDNYDYTIIDCPPSLAVQVRFLMSVAHGFIVPCVPDRLSIRGSVYLMNRVRGLNHKIRPVGTLWSMYRSAVVTHKSYIEAAAAGRADLAALPPAFKTVIPHAAKITEAAEGKTTPASFTKKYTAEFAAHYENLCDEIVKRTQGVPAPKAVVKPKAVRD